MASRGVDRLRVTRRRPVTPAIIRCAEMRAALNHLARDLALGLARIVAILSARATRIDRHAARMLLLMSCYIEVRGPLPNIADHIVEAIAIWGVGADRRSLLVAVLKQVLPREFALPRVRHRLAVWLEHVTPGELRAFEPTARGELPFGLSGELFVGPSRVSHCVVIGDVYDGIIVEAFDRAAGPVRM